MFRKYFFQVFHDDRGIKNDRIVVNECGYHAVWIQLQVPIGQMFPLGRINRPVKELNIFFPQRQSNLLTAGRLWKIVEFQGHLCITGLIQPGLTTVWSEST